MHAEGLDPWVGESLAGLKGVESTQQGIGKGRGGNIRRDPDAMLSAQQSSDTG
jgi:hypothetical protein